MRNGAGINVARGTGKQREVRTTAGAADETGEPEVAAATARPGSADRGGGSKHLLPVLLFAVCLGIYLSNGDFLPGGDQEGNMLSSLNLLKRGSRFPGAGSAGRALRLLLDPGAAGRGAAPGGGGGLELRRRRRLPEAAWCGAAFGMAVLCRPATAVAVVCVGVWLLWEDRRRCAWYVLGGLPLLVILALYDGYYFGSPLVFGQTVVSKVLVLGSGSEDLWQSSWRESLPGLLISPSRGLVWFSPVPVLVLGLVSAVAVWREPRFRPLIPLQAWPGPWRCSPNRRMRSRCCG